MNQTAFPDGFPREPLAAIDFSYFLNDAEKQEWREWLKTSNPSQQEELVNTLHELWLNEQKQAIPNGFNVNQVQQQSNNGNNENNQNFQPQPAQPQTQPQIISEEPAFITPNVQQQPIRSVQPQQNNQGDNQGNNQTNQFSTDNQKYPQKQINQKPAKPNNNSNDENVKNFGNKKYTKNPILDEKKSDSDDFSFENSEENEIKSNQFSDQNFNQNQDKNKIQKQTQAKQSTVESTQRFLNINKLRESATKEDLEKLYTSYLGSREANFKTQKDYVENHGAFLDKVMKIVVNFEEVADYYEAMTGKLIEMNDKLVAQARDVQQIKNEYQNKQLSAQDDIDALKDRVERLEGTVRDLRINTNKKYQEIKDEVSIFEADSLGYDGMAQRFDLLESKLTRLEQNIKSGDQGGSIRDRFAKLQNSQKTYEVENNNRPQGNQQVQNKPASIGKVIDMRDQI